MFPVNQEEGNHLEQEGNNPGDRIRNVQTLRRMELGNLENHIDPANPDAADTQNGNDHGDEGLAKAPQCTGGNIHQTTEEVGQANEAETEHTVANGFLGIGDV